MLLPAALRPYAYFSHQMLHGGWEDPKRSGQCVRKPNGLLTEWLLDIYGHNYQLPDFYFAFQAQT